VVKEKQKFDEDLQNNTRGVGLEKTKAYANKRAWLLSRKLCIRPQNCALPCFGAKRDCHCKVIADALPREPRTTKIL
jgi:hypothetical protein